MADISTSISARLALSSNAWLQAVMITTLAALQLPLLAFLFDPLAINDTDATWTGMRSVLREAVPFSVFFLAAMAVLLTPQRQTLYREWRENRTKQSWLYWLCANLLGFVVLAVATIALNNVDGTTPPWIAFSIWASASGILYFVLARAAAPFNFWRTIIVRERFLFTLGAAAAALITAAMVLSRQSWNGLAEATFQFSAWILRLYETNVIVAPDARLLGVDNFVVNIAAACSGYEGVGLVLAFLSLYLWIFRSTLKFPNALIILPLGVIAIWVLNGVRIALLVSLGAHVSPEIAVTGFHSQAGWMMFLLVTISIMIATHKFGFFHNRAASSNDAPASPGFQLSVNLLAPFLAMTAAGILTAAFTTEGNYWSYALRVIAISGALIVGWRYYRSLDWTPSFESILLGLIVGAAWIVTDPAKSTDSPLGEWLLDLPLAAVIAWIALRFVGTIILVPIAEELAFRGYIHRKAIAEKFEEVAEASFSWRAFFISTALFGLLHGRWLSGALAGAVFALALYRSGRLTGAIMAHMSANALIAFWALVAGQWSLL